MKKILARAISLVLIVTVIITGCSSVKKSDEDYLADKLISIKESTARFSDTKEKNLEKSEEAKAEAVKATPVVLEDEKPTPTEDELWWQGWCDWIDEMDINELSQRTEYGEFGADEELKGNLRGRYAEVMLHIERKQNRQKIAEAQENGDIANAVCNGPWDYSDDTCNIHIEKIWYAECWCYCAHVQITDYTRFGSASANGYYGNGNETTFSAGERLGAIICVNGDFACQEAEPHAAIRRGVVEARGWKPTYVCEAYNSNTGMLFNAYNGYSGYTIQDSADLGIITDTFIFGPAGLNNGYVGGSNGGNKRPRTLIGTTGAPGDLWLVVTAGDYTDGVSPGLTYYEGVKLLQELGCTFGGHLDGGGSSAMYFMGQMLVSNSGTEGRPVGDFAYVK